MSAWYQAKDESTLEQAALLDSCYAIKAGVPKDIAKEIMT